MTTLVGYGSSDEGDDDDDIRPEKPAKIAKTEAQAPDASSHAIGSQANSMHSPSPNQAIPLDHDSKEQESQAPAPRLSAAAVDESTPSARQPLDDGSPLSPHSRERQRLRELTMPTLPNFDIPASPPPPPTNSEEAARLAATTKKFERFLELKKQGVHFNERLQSSSSLRNPSLLPKLMDFAGITKEDSYASTLPDELGVPATWPEECYVERLMKENERREKKRKDAGSGKVDFVPSASKSGASSAAGTPGSTGGGKKGSRFDRR